MEIGANRLYTITPTVTSATDKKESFTDNKELKQEKKEQKNSPQKLSNDEKLLVQKLQARDTEVRAHEAAHKSAGAPTGAASYTYQKGPDNKMYAIGGEVSVSMKSGSTPDETITNAQAVIAAAMAPANPSPQDYAVASNARMVMIKAQQEKTKELQEEVTGKKAYEEQGMKADNAQDTEKSSSETIPQLDIAV